MYGETEAKPTTSSSHSATRTLKAPERLANSMRDLVRFQGMALRDAVLQDDVAFKKKEFDQMKVARADYADPVGQLEGASADEAERLVARQALAGVDVREVDFVDPMLEIHDDVPLKCAGAGNGFEHVGARSAG